MACTGALTTDAGPPGHQCQVPSALLIRKLSILWKNKPFVRSQIK